jgi:Putative MetA-pathway of phenol degradation
LEDIVTKKILLLILVLTMVIFSTVAFAGEQKGKCKYKGPRPVGEINMSNGGVYAKGSMGIIFKTKFFDKDSIYSGSDKISDYSNKPKEAGPRKQERLMTQVTLRYGLLDDLDFRIVVPYWGKSMVRGMKSNGNIAQVNNSNDGLGDIIGMSRYRLLSQKKGDWFNLAAGTGLKMPTGKTDALDESNPKQKYYGMGFQSGTGSWDPKFEIAATKMMKRWRFDTSFMYTLTTEGDRNYEFGDKFCYNFGTSVALNNYFDLQLEYNGIWQGQTRKDGNKLANTGGNRGYITPGVHIKFSKNPNIHLDFGVPILIYRDLNGEQLSEDYQVVGKIALKF